MTKIERAAGVPELDDQRRMNCASCFKELLGESQAVWYDKLPLSLRALYPEVGVRWCGRPYCPGECFRDVAFEDSHNPDTLLHGIEPPREDTTPTQDNAIRAIEDFGEGVID